MKNLVRCSLLAALLAAFLSAMPCRADPRVGEDPDILLGIRLFNETRFSQHFAAHYAGDVNALLLAGDPTVEWTVTTGAPLPGPFAGQSVNCRVCHLDVEFKDGQRGMGRNYSDFARRSPIPDRAEDDLALTVRNSQQLLNVALDRTDAFALHFDAEFPSLEDLVKATLTGRNFGWLPDERAQAVAHIAKVIREDDGSSPIGATFGPAPYAEHLRGTDPLRAGPDDPGLPLLPGDIVNVDTLDDEAIFDVVADFLARYVRSLSGSQDEQGAFNLSPYDVFLRKNALPTQPTGKETVERYTRKLGKRLRNLPEPVAVSEADGVYELHPQAYEFGPEEIRGMRIFFATAKKAKPAQLAAGGIGNCVACHAAPAFTDFRFHNTGIAQEEYDGVHGHGAFAALEIPDLATRNADPGRYLPASAAHPRAPEPFRAIPAADAPGRVDLGLWNVFENPAIGDRERQKALAKAVCKGIGRKACRRAKRGTSGMLDATIAMFKTPGLRDMGHSSPFMHDGSKDTPEAVVEFYIRASGLARSGGMRNAPEQFRGMALTPDDIAPLAAFLRALNEDFE